MPNRIETRATSRRTAICNPIVLREGEHVRLVFVPAIVDNSADPNSCIDGQFVYQRKAQSERWLPIRAASLSTIREGDEFKLTLHARELRKLLEGLVPLYKLHRVQGVPKGSRTFVEVDRGLATLLSEGEGDLKVFLKSRPNDAKRVLLTIVKWLATSSERREMAEELAALAPEQLPEFTGLLGLAALKGALSHWAEHTDETSEEFWQASLCERAYVLGQVFAYPVVVIGTKAYVGGRLVSRTGGKEADFLLAAESTDAVILVEIKNA